MVPIYRSDGEWVAVFKKGNLFNVDGEWIGFVRGRDVHEPGGAYLGYLSDDRRLLRSRAKPRNKPRLQPPPRPPRPEIPATMPLATMFSALPFSTIDLFEEFADRLSYVSDTRPDMD
ncbi:MAG: hypothetical protein GY803_16075 [Chloroflexi bacterium]|nr:hypothetical protein [Chloroflexota bacterium]